MGWCDGRVVLRLGGRLRGVMLALAVAAPGAAEAAEFYVDQAVAVSGNGLSWATAWKRLADINWSALRPGDIVYISGGTAGRSYLEPLLVRAKGTATAPLTITRASQAGHNGPVVLDGRSSAQVGVDLSNVDHVTVRGLEVRNFLASGFSLRYGRGLVVEGNVVHGPGRGVRVFQTSGAVVRGNSVTTPAYAVAQSDGIYSQENQGSLYENNSLILANDEPSGHNDGIQLYRDRDTTIRGNYVEQRNNKTYNAQGIFSEDASGTIRVYNNVVYAPNTRNGLIIAIKRTATDGQLLAFNNTLVGSEWGAVQLHDHPTALVKNNILFSLRSNAKGVAVRGALPAPGSIDHNLYFLPNSTAPAYTSSRGNYSWSAWRQAGFEANGLLGQNPQLRDLENRDFALSESSPAIDAGLAVPWVTADRAGTPRPQGTSHDIGAHEQQAQAGPTTTALSVSVRTCRRRVAR